jgi:hypothetical protein
MSVDLRRAQNVPPAVKFRMGCLGGIRPMIAAIDARKRGGLR